MGEDGSILTGGAGSSREEADGLGGEGWDCFDILELRVRMALDSLSRNEGDDEDVVDEVEADVRRLEPPKTWDEREGANEMLDCVEGASEEEEEGEGEAQMGPAKDIRERREASTV